MKLFQLLFIGFAFLGCKDQRNPNLLSNEGVDSTFQVNSNFNVVLKPDTTIQWPPIIGLNSSKYIQNASVTIKQRGNLTVLVSVDAESVWWPANLPDFISEDDTLVVSGKIFEIPRNERMPGKPIILSTIYIHSIFKNALFSHR